jgi:hypothetical protein
MKKDIGGVGSAEVDVPTGRKIKVRPHSKVALEFNSVDKTGKASATLVSTYPPHPKGAFKEEVFDVNTTAEFAGIVKVGLSFNGKGMSETEKQNLRVYRNDLKKGSVWVDVTLDIDTANNIAYGATDHFSVFGVH